MKNSLISSLLVCAVVFFGVGFYSGKTYQSKQAPANSVSDTASGGFNRGEGSGGRGGRGGFGGMTMGEVVSKDSSGLTLKLRDGGSKVIFVTTSTIVGHMTTGTMDDITTGSNVAVNGATNSDGSITANSIQIRPIMNRDNATGTRP